MTLLHQAAQKAVEAQRALDYEAGWRAAASWTSRFDLLADIGSPAYDRDRAEFLKVALQQQPEAVAEVRIEPDYWSRGHFYEGNRKQLFATGDIEVLPVGTKLYTAPPALQQQPEPVAAIGWLYDWTHSSALGKPDEQFTSLTTDEAHARKHDNPRAVYITPPALQQQEVPREPVAHFPIIYAILRPALSTGNIAVRQHAERLAEVLEGDQLAAVRELLDRQSTTSEPARVIHAASPSTTRQQEAGSEWRLVPVEPTEEMKAKCTDGMSPGRAELWWNDVFAPAYRAMLAAAPSTPENAGGVPGTSNDQQEQPR